MVKKKKRSKKRTDNKEKPLFNLKYFTTTKINLHWIQILTVFIVGYVMYMCKYLKSEPAYLAGVLTALITAIFVSYDMVNKHYTNKATAENENKSKKERYNDKIKLTKDIAQMLVNNQINAESVALLRAIIAETETSVAMNGYGGLNVVEETKFGGQIPLDLPLNTETTNNSTEGMG